jgi:hypothetical protein
MKATQVVAKNPYINFFNEKEMPLILIDIAESFSPNLLDGPPITWELRDMPEAQCFYWCPKPDGTMRKVYNRGTGRTVEVSCDAFGIITTLYLLSHGSFQMAERGQRDRARKLSEQYHRLRNEVFSDDGAHPEHTAIWEAID